MVRKFIRNSLPAIFGYGGVLLAVLVLSLLFGGDALAEMQYAIGTTYLLVVAGGGALWWRGGRSLQWTEALAVAAVSVLLLVPVTSRLFVGWGETDPTLFRHLSVVVPLHLQRFVPVAFMFPLGVAHTTRQRYVTIGIMLLPTAYELLSWFVLDPGQFNWFTTPVALVFTLLVWFAILASSGSLLFVVGRRYGWRPGGENVESVAGK